MVAGDLITILDGAPIAGLSLADVMARLRRPPDARIEARVVHAGQSVSNDISVMRGLRRPGANAVELRVRVDAGKLVAEATGSWPILEFEKGKATPLVAISSGEFAVDHEDRARIAFVRDAAGRVSGLVLNPGPWEQKAAIIPPGPS